MPRLSPVSPAEPEFDFQHHLPAGMESFRVPWLARWFSTSQEHWINLIENGALHGTNLRSPGAHKTMYRVPRAELIAFLNARTQTYRSSR